MPIAKRVTVRLEPALHRALRRKAAGTGRTVSNLVNDAVRVALAEDSDDLAAIEDRKGEPSRSFDEFVADLNRRGES